MKTTHPVIIGIDTHKDSHVAVAINTQGTRLAALSIPTSPKGYSEQYCDPRSVWWMQPLGGERNAMAMFSALTARSRFMRLLIAQPMTRRECRSKSETLFGCPSWRHRFEPDGRRSEDNGRAPDITSHLASKRS